MKIPRIKEGASGVYCITCASTGQRYIGASEALRERAMAHKSKMLHGKSLRKIQVAVDTHGIEDFSFEVLEYCPSQELEKVETSYIIKHNAIKMGFNTFLPHTIIKERVGRSKTTRLSLDLPTDEYAFVSSQANKWKIPMSVFIRRLIWNSMKERKRK
jgi:group I intron endonuclease